MHTTRTTIPAAAMVFILAFASTASAQTVIPLWERGAPGFESRRDEPEQHKDWWYKNIHNPSLTVFLPPAGKANGTAVIVAPGGGHRELVFDPEGVEPARYLASLGITAFALKYRLFRETGSPYQPEHMAQDIRRAMRTVRARAAEWKVDPQRIGVMGWSAGGEVAAMVAYPPVGGDARAADPIERVSARPDFQILIYPGPLGIPDRIPADAPPLFVLGAADDEYVAQVMFDITRKYRDARASVEAHIYAQGKHAFNMGQRSQYVSIRHWPQRLAEWLEDRGYLRAVAP
jgi:acetyl esterase/lipase